MIIHIEPESELPIYAQLTNQIIEGIAGGLLRPGDSLPSVRAFAADLGVNMHTVNKSYHELERKGIIQIVPKSGAVIRFPQAVSHGDTEYERLKSDLKPMVAEALVLGMDEKAVAKMIDEIIRSF